MRLLRRTTRLSLHSNRDLAYIVRNPFNSLPLLQVLYILMFLRRSIPDQRVSDPCRLHLAS